MPTVSIKRSSYAEIFEARPAAISVRFDLNEALYALTRRGEGLQVDELPIGVLVLLVCLMWLAWRRYRQARVELHARQAAEARLEALLAENRELAQENFRIQQAERKRVARELHDELGQYLQVITLMPLLSASVPRRIAPIAP